MSIVSKDIERSVNDLRAIGEIAADASPDQVKDLIVTRARDLSGLDTFVNLETLSIISADIPDYSSLRALGHLRVLIIEHANLSTVDDLPLANLQVVRLRHDRVASLAFLDGAPRLQILDVSGNPLDLAATELVDRLARSGALCTRDDDSVLELNAHLRDAGTPYVCSGTAAACVLTLTGLATTDTPDRVITRTTVADVERALALGTLAVLEQEGTQP